MTVLVVGATGATGKHLVAQLLVKGHLVRAIVRSVEKLPETLRNHNRITLIQGSILDMKENELLTIVNGCDAFASCLGHSMSLKGIYGHPRKLVRDSIHKLCNVIIKSQPEKPVKFVLMNTAGNQNSDIDEPISASEKFIIGLLRLLVPPHIDNEEAADYLRSEISQKHQVIEWVVVRPDTLIDEEDVTAYELYPSPVRSAIFDAGKTSRINVGHFMAELITNKDTWSTWIGQMPVIYNKE
jgi:nucleoside-diphosphate-sugar epimerase